MSTEKRNIGARWTPELVKTGFTPVPDVFLDLYTQLSPPIRPVEALFLIHLVRFKWDERPPHPSFARLAKNMGISVPSARAIARSLEKKGYLKRQVRSMGSTNRFFLLPLFKKLEEAQQKRSKSAQTQIIEEIFKEVKAD